MTRLSDKEEVLKRMRKSAAEKVKERQLALRKMATLAESTPSATRSDSLVVAFREEGVDEAYVARKIKEMTEATTTRKAWHFNEDKRKMEFRKEVVPDYKTQRDAVKFVIDVCGWAFQLPKQDVQVNVNTLQIAKDVASMTPQQIIIQANSAANRLKDVDPRLFEAAKDMAQEAEVVDEDDPVL